MESKKKLVVISGLSGSGKTVALRALEDLGYYCIDNLPSSLLSELTKQIVDGSFVSSQIALTLDCRDSGLIQIFSSMFPKLNDLFDLNVVFLTAREDVILKRFRETRRQHPLINLSEAEKGDSQNLKNLIQLEGKLLKSVEEVSNLVIDTSDLNSPMLRRIIRNDFSNTKDGLPLNLALVSFGFKYGIPPDMDLVLDVRCFDNPYYDPALRSQSGLIKEVRDFVLRDKNVEVFIEKIVKLVLFLYPLYQLEGKSFLSGGFGCTGGKHRSVVIVESIFSQLSVFLPKVTIEHRHLDKE